MRAHGLSEDADRTDTRKLGLVNARQAIRESRVALELASSRSTSIHIKRDHNKGTNIIRTIQVAACTASRHALSMTDNS